ncbi:MAG TPA: glycoside hydrolase family 9 protein [Pyrinomonadaceae bacterium]|nr:glycoside hydrolase family 9 protein [Pyrinomonadaceae bacterium]
MRRLLNALLACVLLAPCATRAADSRVRLNTVGFLPEYSKRASVAAKFREFSVVEVGGKARVVFRGRARGPLHNEDTDEDLYVADFSALKRPGLYKLEVGGVGSSPPFRVAQDVYDEPFRAAVRAMYLWRCGAAVSATYDGVTYAHAACHTEDAWLDYVGGGHARRDSTGGWHDAGDYNKYVVNAGVTVGLMLLAWEQFGAQIQSSKLDARGGLPAYLGEVKWETDWLLKMQATDGSVYHKVSTRDFGAAIPPEDEKAERYFTPRSSAATADFAAMLASASRAFRPYDRAYARTCLDAARRAYDFLRANPRDQRADLRGFNTGGYQTQDADERLWAAAELWEATGEAGYLSDLEKRAGDINGAKFDPDWGWSDVKNLGLLTYLFSKREGRDEETLRDVREALVYAADKLVERRDAHGYARPLGTRYYWGCNGGVANTVVLLRSADRLEPRREYVEAALDAVSHLFGRNYYGRSFVTGVGFNPPLHPHHRPSMRPGGKDTWPGYLVGGGWPRATDWVDVSENYRVNEVAINWNAPLIYALAGFLQRRSHVRDSSLGARASLPA